MADKLPFLTSSPCDPEKAIEGGAKSGAPFIEVAAVRPAASQLCYVSVSVCVCGRHQGSVHPGGSGRSPEGDVGEK